jgi:hypothetical protein
LPLSRCASSQHLIFSSVPLVLALDHTKMERVHRLLAEGTLDAETGYFWSTHWPHIASAKVPLETKTAAYRALRLRGVASTIDLRMRDLYAMLRSDRAFVAELDLGVYSRHFYRICTMCIDDDVAALALYLPTISDDAKFPWSKNGTDYSLKQILVLILLEIDAPLCLHFLLQDKALRERMTTQRMTPLAQRFVEELVQPTDHLDSWLLLLNSQSVKLVGMCLEDEEMVEAWLNVRDTDEEIGHGHMSVPFARKLHALATPDQSLPIKFEVWSAISEGFVNEGYFELAWLFGLLPFDPIIRACFLRNNVRLFPAFTFAMIVALCDRYLEVTHTGISESQKRFFSLVTRLPMDLQALISLRLQQQASTVISSDQFNRAFLAVV